MSFIKLDRRIMKWGWYRDTNTLAVWLHLLLSANFKRSEYMGVDVDAGQVVTTLEGLSEETGLSVKQVRRAIEKLEKTGEIVKKRQSHFTLITILKWAKYQCEGNQMGIDRAMTGQSDGQSQQYKKLRSKEYKNVYNDHLPVYDTSKNKRLSKEEIDSLLALRNRDTLPVYDTSRNTRMSSEEEKELLSLMGRKYES